MLCFSILFYISVHLAKENLENRNVALRLLEIHIARSLLVHISYAQNISTEIFKIVIKLQILDEIFMRSL